MCGSVRHEHLGELMPGATMNIIRQDGQIFQARWDGFARQEEVQSWIAHSWKPGDLLCSGYKEGRNWYEVERNRCINVVVRAVGSKNEQVFKIITRSACGVERDIHPRFPRTGLRRY